MVLGEINWPKASQQRGFRHNDLDQNIKIGADFNAQSFRVNLEKYTHDAVKRAVALEKEGKSDQAEAVVKSASSFAAEFYGLSESDIKYLLELASGNTPKSRWGKTHLVRAGLVELDGGKLTSHGRGVVEYLKAHDSEFGGW